MKISQIYNKMMAEKLSYCKTVSRLETPITIQGLYYHIKKYCQTNSLPLPRAKRGRKKMIKDFNLKNPVEYLKGVTNRLLELVPNSPQATGSSHEALGWEIRRDCDRLVFLYLEALKYSNKEKLIEIEEKMSDLTEEYQQLIKSLQK